MLVLKTVKFESLPFKAHPCHDVLIANGIDTGTLYYCSCTLVHT